MPTRWRIRSLLLIAALLALAAAVALPAAARVSRAAPAGQADSCVEVVTNGGFEVDFGWQFDPSATPPQYVTTLQRAGSRSLQLGVVGPTSGSSSSAARQTVTVPSDATSAILSFWHYPIVEASPGADRFEFAALSADGSTVLAGPWQLPIGLEVWQPAAFDFSLWRGQTFQLYFNVFNDGVGGRTVVFLDDVEFKACAVPPDAPTLTPTWTPWPTPWFTPTAWPTPLPTSWPPFPTATPPAGGCFDVLQNGNFDLGLAGWVEGNNSLRPAAVASPALTAPFAAQMGATTQNLNSFSSIRQTVTVPAGQRIFIGFWVYTWAESLSGNDRQQFVLLGPGDVVWATPWKVLENAGGWQQHLYEVIGAPSQTFDVYFAAVNDGVGGRTALYVDEAHVWACVADAMPVTGALGVGSALDAMDATALSAAPVAPEVIPFTPEPSLVVEPAIAPEAVFAPESVATPEATVTPIIVPLVTSAPVEGRVIAEATPLPQGTPVDVTGLPTPGWTEVAISGQPTVTSIPVAQIAPTGTPPPEGRAIGTPALNPEAMLTQAVAVVATVAPATDRLPFGLFNTISERTAQWPIAWPWVLLIIVVVVAVLIWIIRRSSRGSYYNP